MPAPVSHTRIILLLLVPFLLWSCSKHRKLEKNSELIGVWEYQYSQVVNWWSGTPGPYINQAYSDVSYKLEFKRSRLVVYVNSDKVCSCRYKWISQYYQVIQLGEPCHAIMGDVLTLEEYPNEELILLEFPFPESNWPNAFRYDGNIYRKIE